MKNIFIVADSTLVKGLKVSIISNYVSEPREQWEK